MFVWLPDDLKLKKQTRKLKNYSRLLSRLSENKNHVRQKPAELKLKEAVNNVLINRKILIRITRFEQAIFVHKYFNMIHA